MCKHVGRPKVNENMLKRALITDEQIDQQPTPFLHRQMQCRIECSLIKQMRKPGQMKLVGHEESVTSCEKRRSKNHQSMNDIDSDSAGCRVISNMYELTDRSNARVSH